MPSCSESLKQVAVRQVRGMDCGNPRWLFHGATKKHERVCHLPAHWGSGGILGCREVKPGFCDEDVEWLAHRLTMPRERFSETYVERSEEVEQDTIIPHASPTPGESAGHPAASLLHLAGWR